MAVFNARFSAQGSLSSANIALSAWKLHSIRRRYYGKGIPAIVQLPSIEMSAAIELVELLGDSQVPTHRASVNPLLSLGRLNVTTPRTSECLPV